MQYIPAPYDPMQAAIQKLGQSIGGQFGDKVINPLLGNYTAAQRQQKDNQSLLGMTLDPNSERGQLNAQQRYASGQQLLPGQQYQGEMGTQMPQMMTTGGQDMLKQWLSGQMQIGQQGQLANILSPLQQQQLAQNAAMNPLTQQAAQQQLSQNEEMLPLEKKNLQARTKATERQGRPTKLDKARLKEIEEGLKPNSPYKERIKEEVLSIKSQREFNEKKAVQTEADRNFNKIATQLELQFDALKANRDPLTGMAADEEYDKELRATIMVLIPKLETARRSSESGQPGKLNDPLGMR